MNFDLIVQDTIVGGIHKLLIQFWMSLSSRAHFKVVGGKLTS